MNPHTYIRKDPYQLYIGGNFVPSARGDVDISVHPCDNREFARYYRGGREDIMKAVGAAREAFDNGPWSIMSARERGRLLLKAADILGKRTEDFACTEALDCGKLYSGLLYFEVPQAIDAFEFAAGSARHLNGKTVPVDGGGGNMNIVIWQPKGVIGEILPWNGPFMMGCQKIASILAAGNTVVVKPPSRANISLLKLAEVFHEAGFPPGVVNIVTGSGEEAGTVLVENRDVDMVSMTGGTETGRRIIESSAGTVKDIALELGGKSPNIVFDDVDLDDAVDQAIHAFTLNAGQVCVAGTRLLVHAGIHDEFVVRLCGRLEETIRPGDVFKEETNFQPLISKSHKNTVMDYIELGKKEGARLVTGGRSYDDQYLSRGNFIAPTVFTGVTPDMRIFQEEIFGPVLCVTSFSDEDEAVSLANNSRYGLAGAVFTRDVQRSIRVASRLHAGQVYVNTYYSKGINESPGAGWKESGLGIAGIHKYMHSKTVFIHYSE